VDWDYIGQFLDLEDY